MTSNIELDATMSSQNEADSSLSASTGTPESPPAATAPRQGRADWRRRYARNVWFTDLLVLIWVVYGTQIAWFGFGNAEVSIRADARLSDVS